MNRYWRTIKCEMDRMGIMSWYELARLSQINESTIANTRNRNGYLSFKNTCKIARILNIPLDNLDEWKD